MSFHEVVSTIASIVAIVGGVLGIISTLSKEPVFLRFWKHQASQQIPADMQPSSNPSKPVVEGTSTSIAQRQPDKSLPIIRFQVDLIFGLILSVLAILIIIGTQAAYAQTYSTIPAILAYVGMGMLSISAGLFPSRASGTLLSSVIAGGILGGVSFLTVLIGSLIFNLPFSFIPGLALFGVLPFAISLLFGFLGRYLHNTFQAVQ